MDVEFYEAASLTVLRTISDDYEEFITIRQEAMLTNTKETNIALLELCKAGYASSFLYDQKMQCFVETQARAENIEILWYRATKKGREMILRLNESAEQIK